MTGGRLTGDDLAGLSDELRDYDSGLILKTGLSLKEIALCSTKSNRKKVIKAIKAHRVAVIPVTAGLGVIENFTGAVSGIISYMGAETIITDESDVAGLAECMAKGCDIAFLADDNKFIALNFASKKIIDNTESTASGYTCALDAMVRGLKNREVLVIGGAGRVGLNAVMCLDEKKAKVAVYDPGHEKCSDIFKKYKVCVETDLDAALKKYRLIFDASDAGGIIKPEHIYPDTFVAAPGIPPGLTEKACFKVKDRLIHDVLQIGVATMFAKVLS